MSSAKSAKRASSTSLFSATFFRFIELFKILFVFLNQYFINPHLLDRTLELEEQSSQEKLNEAMLTIAKLQKKLAEKEKRDSEATNQIHELYDVIKCLESDKTDLNNEIAALKKSYSQIQLVLGHTKHKLTQENNKLVEENKKLVVENEKLVEEKNKLVEENNKLVEVNKYSSNQFDELWRICSEQEEIIEQLRKDLKGNTRR